MNGKMEIIGVKEGFKKIGSLNDNAKNFLHELSMSVVQYCAWQTRVQLIFDFASTMHIYLIRKEKGEGSIRFGN